MTRAAGAIALLLVAVVAIGCESTQDKSAHLEAAGSTRLKDEKGLHIVRKAAGVTVGATAVLQDANGAAVVAELRNTSEKALRDVPIAVDVAGAGGRSVYKNDEPGLDASLTGVSLLPPHASLLWVDDQISATGKGKRVAIVVGAPRKSSTGREPKLTLSSPTIRNDPTSGIEAAASVTNHSKVPQRNLVVLGVARRGRSIVAAGRAIVPIAKPGKTTRFSLFFIGNPKGARVTLSAPPTTFQ